MIYAIRWLETHNPNNWGDNYEKGKREILDSLPNAKIEDVDEESWITVLCEDKFKAKNIKEAKKIAREYEVGDNGVFTVSDEKGKAIFDEDSCYKE